MATNDAPKLRANAVTQVSEFAPGEATMTISVPKSGHPPIMVKFGNWSPEVREQALFEGVKKRLINMAALGDNASALDKYNEIKRAADHYATGTTDWRIPSVATGPRLDPIILAAIVEVTGKALDAVRAMVASGAKKAGVTEPDYVIKLGTAPSVKEVADRLREEAAAKRAEGVDADAELEAMMEGGEGEE